VVGKDFEEWIERKSPAEQWLHPRGFLGRWEMEVEVVVVVVVVAVAVELFNGWTQEPELSLRWKPGWGIGMGMYTASPPTRERSGKW
jgi:hypothetical protein